MIRDASENRTTVRVASARSFTDSPVADGERSVILDQVEAGVAVRMAVLYNLAAEGGSNSSVTRLTREG